MRSSFGVRAACIPKGKHEAGHTNFPPIPITINRQYETTIQRSNIKSQRMNIGDKASKGIGKLKKEVQVLKGEESKDRLYMTTRPFDDDDAAAFEFGRCKERLFNVNRWSDIPGAANSGFALFDSVGEPLTESQRVEKGDFIRIDLPGPLPYYWVKVTSVTDDDDIGEFVVQPAYDPTRRDDTTVTDHFFRDQARSVFRVERKGNEISAMEIGLNETINNQGEESGDKGFVNTLVAQGGWAGFQKYQWQNLTDYITGIRTPKK